MHSIQPPPRPTGGSEAAQVRDAPKHRGQRLVRLVCLAGLAAAALSSCGGAPTPDAAEASAEAAAQPRPTVHWAQLLPIETRGVLRIDLARLRRSPHGEVVRGALEEVVSGLGDEALQEAVRGLLERTDQLLVGLIPSADGGEEEIVALARGTYEPDEIDRLASSGADPSSPTGGPNALEVDGRRVWLQPGGAEPVALASVRDDLLAMTSTLERMERLLARRDMRAQAGARWPPAVREGVAEASLEDATIGVSLSRSGRRGGQRGLAMVGRADLDGPLDVRISMNMGSPAMAAMAAMAFQGMLQGLSEQVTEDAFALRQLASLARIEASGERVIGSLHADRDAAVDLVPVLLRLLMEEGSEPDSPLDGPAPPTIAPPTTQPPTAPPSTTPAPPGVRPSPAPPTQPL